MFTPTCTLNLSFFLRYKLVESCKRRKGKATTSFISLLNLNETLETGFKFSRFDVSRLLRILGVL